MTAGLEILSVRAHPLSGRCDLDDFRYPGACVMMLTLNLPFPMRILADSQVGLLLLLSRRCLL